MSHFLDRLNYFSNPKEAFSGGHGVTTGEDRTWEDAYRDRWAHDKIVRSTHGVNCTGSCSWKIYVKGGIVTWETQQTDYPRTRPDLPNHEPRGCARGASYSWRWRTRRGDVVRRLHDCRRWAARSAHWCNGDADAGARDDRPASARWWARRWPHGGRSVHYLDFGRWGEDWCRIDRTRRRTFCGRVGAFEHQGPASARVSRRRAGLESADRDQRSHGEDGHRRCGYARQYWWRLG